MNFNFSPEIQPNYKEVEINEIKTRRTEDIKDLQRKLNEERSSMSKEDRRKNMAKLMESMAEEFSEEPAGKAEVEMHQNIIEDSTFESRTVAEELNAIENEENQNSR